MIQKPQSSIPIVVLIFLAIGCTEKNSFIDLSTTQKVVDTTYVANVEQPQLRRILIEEFTGVSCPPCPNGHEIVRSLKRQYPERIIVVANHIFNFPQAAPVKDLSKQDFRTQEATDIGKLFGGVSSMPASVFNRKKIGNDYLVNTTLWASAVSSFIESNTPINIYANSTFDKASGIAKVKIKLAYTATVSERHAITLAITESSIIDAQKSQSTIDTFYTHNYVLRDVVTQLGGSTVLDNVKVKEAGRVIERVFEVPINSTWQVANCKIVAFVHKMEGDQMEVYQSVEAEIQ